MAKRKLTDFWPTPGASWDALGKTSQGNILLVEAKSHIKEIDTPSTGATDPDSVKLIQHSLNEIKDFLKAKSKIDWSQVFYQYTNRLAYLFLLRELDCVPTCLVNVYFYNDLEQEGPESIEEWRGAIKLQKIILGLNKQHRLSKHIVDVFIDVEDLKSLSYKKPTRCARASKSLIL